MVLGDGGTTLTAKRGEKPIWKTQFQNESPTSLQIDNGRVILQPSGTVFDLATGKMLEKH